MGPCGWSVSWGNGKAAAWAGCTGLGLVAGVPGAVAGSGRRPAVPMDADASLPGRWPSCSQSPLPSLPDTLGLDNTAREGDSLCSKR